MTKPEKKMKKVSAQVGPHGTLELLSQLEMQTLSSADTDAAQSDVMEMFRKCALAVCYLPASRQ